MELRQLVTFRMLTTTLSFSRTAQALNYVQSSVTMQMQVLEEELGVRLFDRLGKRVALTDAGKRLLPYAEKMLMLSEEARQAVVEEEVPGGSLTISAPETLCTYRLPTLLREFSNRFPQVRLIFRPLPSTDLRRCVSEGSVDMAFVIDEPMQSTALVVEKLVAEPLLILVSPDHRLAQSSPLIVHELQGEPCLLTEVGCSYRVLFEHALHEEGIHPTTNLEFTSVEAIKQCVMAKMGVTFLPAIAVSSEISQGRLVALPWVGHDFQVLTQMIWHRERWISPALNAFLTVTREVFSAFPAREEMLQTLAISQHV